MAGRKSNVPAVSFFAFQDIITAVVGIFILITLIMVLELAERVEQSGSGESENIQPIISAIDALAVEVARLQAEFASRSDQVSTTIDLNAFNRAEKVDALKFRLISASAQQQQLDQRVQQINQSLAAAKAEQDRLVVAGEQLKSKQQLIAELVAKMCEVQGQVSLLAGNTSEVYRDLADDGRFVTLITLSAGQIKVRDSLTRSVKEFDSPRRSEQFVDWLAVNDVDRRQFMVFIEPGGALDFDSLKESLVEVGAVYGYTVVESGHPVQLGFELGAAP